MTAFFATAITITRLGATFRLPRWLAKRESWMRVIEACGLFGKLWRESCLAYLLSVPVLFGTFLSFYCAARGFGAAVSLMDILWIMSPSSPSSRQLPISFSGIGVREQLFKTFLADLTGIPAEVAVLISLGRIPELHILESGGSRHLPVRQTSPNQTAPLERPSLLPGGWFHRCEGLMYEEMYFPFFSIKKDRQGKPQTAQQIGAQHTITGPVFSGINTRHADQRYKDT